MLNYSTDLKSPILQGKVVMGRVVVNNDPLHLRRIKVRVDNLHPTTTEDNDLPWVMDFSAFGNQNSQGGLYIPDLDTIVAVMYTSDDLYSGIYLGSFPNVELELLDNYPNTYGFIDRLGSLYLANTETGYYTFYHASGTKISVDGSGHTKIQVNSTAGADEETTNSKGVDIQVYGNVNLTSNENITFNAKNMTINMEESFTVNTPNVTSSSNNLTLNGQNTSINTNSVNIGATSSAKVQSSGSMQIIGGGGSYDCTSVSTIDGKPIGIYRDTCEGSTISTFSAFAPAGSPATASPTSPQEVKVKLPELDLAEPRENQATRQESTQEGTQNGS